MLSNVLQRPAIAFQSNFQAGGGAAVPVGQPAAAAPAPPASQADAVSRAEGAGRGVEKVAQGWGRIGGVIGGATLAGSAIGAAVHLVHPATVTLTGVAGGVAMAGVVGLVAAGGWAGYHAAGKIMNWAGQAGSFVARKMGVSEVAGRRVAKAIVGAGVAVTAGVTIGTLHIPGAAIALGSFGLGAALGALTRGGTT